MSKFEIIYNLPIGEYHGDKHISCSKLNVFLKSRKLFYYDYVQGKKSNDTSVDLVKLGDPLAFGSAFHACVGEGMDEYNKLYAVKPPKMDRRTKAGKEAFQAFTESIGDRLPIDRDAHDAILEMRSSIYQNEVLGRAISSADAEVTIRGVVFDIPVQCRPDLLLRDIQDPEVASLLGVDLGDNVIIDLKTTKDVGSFEYSIRSFKYYRQAPFYQYLCAKAGIPIKKFIFLAVEKQPPYDNKLFQIGDDSAHHGADEVVQGLADLSNFLKNPTPDIQPDTEIHQVELPEHARLKLI